MTVGSLYWTRGIGSLKSCTWYYVIEGQVIDTVMIGQNSDISHLCEYEWFQWVIYYQPKEGYPDDKMAMERYLGPTIEVGNAIT